MKKTTYIKILERFRKKQITPEEFYRLKEWFSSDSSYQELFTYYQYHWNKASRSFISTELQAKIYRDLKFKMKRDTSDKTDYWNKKKSFFYHRIAYAAIFLLCITMGYSVYLYMKTQDIKILSIPYQEYILEAEKGQRATLSLPDGTKVWLNSQTELIYSNEYGVKERLVLLKGEAYFEVAKEEEKRFIVKAGSMEVEALGTSFNVKAYEEEDNIITTLFTGKVRAAVEDEEMILYPDSYVAFNKKDRIFRTGPAENTHLPGMWRNNELDFQNQTLQEIAVLLSRLYDVQIVFASDQIRKYSFSGIIKNTSLENVIESITETSSVICERKGNTIVLRE